MIKIIKYILIFIFFIFILLFGIAEYFLNKSFKNSGVVIKADVKEFIDSGYDSKNSITPPKVFYCYHVDSQEYCSDGIIKDTATYNICKKYGKNAQIEIIYLPNDPEMCTLKGSINEGGLNVWLSIGLGVILILVLVYPKLAKKYGKNVKLKFLN